MFFDSDSYDDLNNDAYDLETAKVRIKEIAKVYESDGENPETVEFCLRHGAFCGKDYFNVSTNPNFGTVFATGMTEALKALNTLEKFNSWWSDEWDEEVMPNRQDLQFDEYWLAMDANLELDKFINEYLPESDNPSDYDICGKTLKIEFEHRGEKYIAMYQLNPTLSFESDAEKAEIIQAKQTVRIYKEVANYGGLYDGSEILKSELVI